MDCSSSDAFFFSYVIAKAFYPLLLEVYLILYGWSFPTQLGIYFHLQLNGQVAETRGGIIAFMVTRTLYALQTALDITALGVALTGFTDISRLFDTCCQVKRPECLTELVVATVLKNLKECRTR